MFTGCGTALVTPFTRDLYLDEPTFRRLVRRQIEAGIHFLVPCGTTGESPTLTRAEHLRVVEICLEEAQGKTPVLAGAGGYNTAEVIALAQELERMGVQGILSVTPYYNKPTAEGVYQHYKAIAASTSLPVIVYNVPGRTNVNVAPDTLVRLAEIDNIVGVKEASGVISQIVSILNRVPEDFTVFSGDDALTLPMMALGARGIISVASNVIPKSDGAPGGIVPRERFHRGARAASRTPPADGNQLYRNQPNSRKSVAGPDGPSGTGLPPAAGPSFARKSGKNPRLAKIAADD
jgi:4-hydroxy-tetrahydrodipicolinate synthase